MPLSKDPSRRPHRAAEQHPGARHNSQSSPAHRRAEEVYSAGVRAARPPFSLAHRQLHSGAPSESLHSASRSSFNNTYPTISNESFNKPSNHSLHTPDLSRESGSRPRWATQPYTPPRVSPPAEDEGYDQLRSSTLSIKTPESARSPIPITPIRPRSAMKRRRNDKSRRSALSQSRNVHFAEHPLSSPPSLPNASQPSTVASSPATVLETPRVNVSHRPRIKDSFGPWARPPSDSPRPNIFLRDLFSPELPRSAKRRKTHAWESTGNETNPIDLSLDTDDEKESVAGEDGEDELTTALEESEGLEVGCADLSISSPGQAIHDDSLSDVTTSDTDSTNSENPALPPRLFVPVSAEGGIIACCERINVMCELFEDLAGATIFLNSPKKRVEAFSEPDPQTLQMLQQLPKDFFLMAHGNHATNFASQDHGVAEASLRSLKLEMRKAGALGIKLLVIHLGNTGLADPKGHRKATRRLAKALGPVLDAVPDVTLAIETMTGRCTGETSRSIDDIRRFIKKVNRPGRLKVCVDLCHVYLRHDLIAEDGRRSFFEAVERLGEGNIAALHVSDSLEQHGSDADAHANLEFGYMGIDTMREILRHPLLQGVPTILETPTYSSRTRDGKSALAQQIWQVERNRTTLELELLHRAIATEDDEWTVEEPTLVGRYLENKRKIEGKILRLEKRLNNAETRASQEHRLRIRSKLAVAAKARTKRRGRNLRFALKRPQPGSSVPAPRVSTSSVMTSPPITRSATQEDRERRLAQAADDRRNASGRLSFFEDPAFRAVCTPPPSARTSHTALSSSPSNQPTTPAVDGGLHVCSQEPRRRINLQTGDSTGSGPPDPYRRTFYQNDMEAGSSQQSGHAINRRGHLDWQILSARSGWMPLSAQSINKGSQGSKSSQKLAGHR